MCDSLVRLTDDGVLVAANAGGAPDDSQVLRWYPALDHAAGATVAPGDGRVAQVPRTHAVLLAQPWWSWGAEAGANEHGVTVVRTPVAARGRTRGTDALAAPDLVRLALERGRDRREATEALVSLLEEHGQGARADRTGGGSSAFVVADPAGATVVETAGREHATEEVEGSRVLAGALSIGSFAARHADGRAERRASAPARRQRGEAYLAAEDAEPLEAAMAALRDHGPKARGATPDYRRRTGAVGGACMHAGGLLASTQTVASWASDLRGGAAGAVHWATGTAAPCTSLFVPLRVGEPTPLDPVDPALGQAFDPAYLWWRHERLHRLALRDPERALPVVADVRDRLEADWRAAPPTSEEALALGDAWRDDLVDRLVELAEVGLADTRPVRVAAQWRRWNRAAGVAL